MQAFTWLRWLKETLSPVRSRRRGERKRSRTILRLENLEERLTPAVHNGAATFATIQAAVNAANPGDTLLADAGVYAENVTINKSLILEGAQHGVDARNGRPGAQESILDAATNGGKTLFDVTANNVTLDGFVVQNETSANQFGFGIVLGAGTSGAHVINNIIQNNIAGISLANNPAGSSGVIQHNLIRNNNQAGPGSGDGIYTDQFNAGGTLANVLIDSNTFSGNSDAGLDFSSTDTTKPSTAITISNNLFDANSRGLLAFNLTSSSITGNTFSNSTSNASADLRLFEGDSGVSITNNVLATGAGRAVRISNAGTGAPDATNISFTQNSISGYTGPAGTFQVDNYTGTLDASLNWWGAATGPTIASNPAGTGQTIADPNSAVDYSPWLETGTDTDLVTPGFQPDLSNLGVNAGSPKNAAQVLATTGNLQEGVNDVTAGGTVHVAAGTYTENVTINKSLTLLGAGSGTTILTSGAGTGLAVTGATVTLSGLTVSGFATGLSAASGTTRLSLTDFVVSGNTVGGSIANVATINLAATPTATTFNVSGTFFTVNGDQNITYTGATTMNLTGGAGNDFFNIGANVNSLAAVQTAINIDGGANNAAPTVTQSASVNGTTITNTLPVGDTVQIIDFQNPNAGTYTLTATTMQRAGTGLITLTNVETVNAFFAPGNDTVNVATTPAASTTFYSFGFDIFNVTTTAASSTLLIYAATAGSATNVTSTGAGSLLLVHGNSGSDQITLHGTGAASGIHFDGFGGTDFIDIQATAAGSLTQITDGPGRGFFVVGNTANSLSGILGNVSLAGLGGGADDLTINDQGDAAKRTYNLTANELSRTGAADVFYAGMTGLTVNGSGGNDLYNVASKSATTPTALRAGAGNDLFVVAVDMTSGYAAFLVDGGTGVDSLFVADQTGTAIVHIVPDSPTSGHVNVNYNVAGAQQSQIAYRRIANVSTSPSPS